MWFALLAVVLLGPVAPLLARARWPQRAPWSAVVLWQAVGIAGALAAIGFGISITVAPMHTGLLPGVTRLANQALAGNPLRDLGLSGALGLTLATDVCTVLLMGLAVTMIRTTAARSRHRQLLDLVGRPISHESGALVLEDSRAAAYYLPGLRPRIVVSTGTLDLLDENELGAVLAHERGHAHGRHGIIMLPLASMDALLRWMPYARHARAEVAMLLEMAADDYATKRIDSCHLAGALIEMATSGVAPGCTLAAGTTAVTIRVKRLLNPTRNSRIAATFALLSTSITIMVPLTVFLARG